MRHLRWVLLSLGAAGGIALGATVVLWIKSYQQSWLLNGPDVTMRACSSGGALALTRRQHTPPRGYLPTHVRRVESIDATGLRPIEHINFVLTNTGANPSQKPRFDYLGIVRGESFYYTFGQANTQHAYTEHVVEVSYWLIALVIALPTALCLIAPRWLPEAEEEARGSERKSGKRKGGKRSDSGRKSSRSSSRSSSGGSSRRSTRCPRCDRTLPEPDADHCPRCGQPLGGAT